MESHDVTCDGPAAHRLVSLEILDGEPSAELHTAGGIERLSGSAAGGSVIVSCACGSFAFEVGRYLAGEWVDPVRLDPGQA